MKPINLKKGIITLVILSCFNHINAQNIYVSKKGNDANPGTASKPFKTIKKASSVAKPGNTIIIGGGIYEEEIIPARSGVAGSPIKYKGKIGEKVVISAMQTVNNWTLDKGQIYKAPVDWDLGQDNSAFHKDQLMDLARWPNNIPQNPFLRDFLPGSDKGKNGGGETWMNYNGSESNGHAKRIPFAGKWEKGGSINFYGGAGFLAWTDYITKSTSNRINFTLERGQNWIQSRHHPGYTGHGIKKGEFFLQGIKEALDYKNEWYYDKKTKTLFVQIEGGGAPAKNTLSFRRRIHTIKLNKNYITVENLAVFGGEIEIKGNNNKLFKVSSFYGNHTLGVIRGFNSGRQSVLIKGNNNTVERCEIAWGAGSGVFDQGKNNKLLNSYVHDFNYLGNYDCVLNTRGSENGIYKNNTLTRSGKDIIQAYSNGGEYAFNDVSQGLRIADDGGLLYTTGERSKKASIHHNTFHDAKARKGRFKATGIYLDNDSKNWDVYNNVVWNTQWTNIQINWNGTNLNIFNNTFVKGSATMGAWHKAGTKFSNVKVWNNITDKEAVDKQGNQESESTWEPQSNKQNNLVDQASFINFKANNYKLKNSAKAVDFGRVINGYTDGFKGKSPDVGAYEIGSNWVSGPNWNLTQGPTGVCYGLPGENCSNTGGGDSVRPDANLVNGVYYIQNTSGKIKMNSPNGRTVNTADASGNSAKWQITKVGTYYTIKNLRNNEFLEVPYAACNKNENTENPNINLGTWTSVESNHQKWSITKVEGDYFLQPLHCDKVVDRNNGNSMHLWPYRAGNKNQNWKIISADEACSTSIAVSNLRINEHTDTSITLEFDKLNGVNKYEVRAWPKGEFTGNINSPKAISYADGNSSPITIDGLKAGTEYTLVIRAICSVGGSSELAQIDAFTFGPCSVDSEITSIRTVGVTNQSISIGFKEFTGENRYEVRAWPKGQFTGNINSPKATSYAGGNSSPITIAGLAAGKEYTIVLRAICATGGASKLMKVDSATSGVVARSSTEVNAELDVVVLYPNPLKEGFLTVSLGNSKMSKISILDIQGKRIYEIETNKQNLKLEKTLFGEAGLYFIRVEQNEVFTVKKVLIE